MDEIRKPYRAAIFDLDGTLLDSMGVWEEVDTAFLAKRGIQLPDDYIRAVTPMGYEQAVSYTIDRFSLKESKECVKEELFSLAIDAYRYRVGLKAGVREYLAYLKEEGIMIAGATASAPVLFEPCLRHNAIDHYFTTIVSGSEVKRGKGHPDIYWEAASRLGVAPEDSLVFEDILPGIKGALAGGFRAVGVEDPWSRNDREEIRALAESLISDFRQLLP